MQHVTWLCFTKAIHGITSPVLRQCITILQFTLPALHSTMLSHNENDASQNYTLHYQHYIERHSTTPVRGSTPHYFAIAEQHRTMPLRNNTKLCHCLTTSCSAITKRHIALPLLTRHCSTWLHFATTIQDYTPQCFTETSPHWTVPTRYNAEHNLAETRQCHT